jgi:hypothetical protein
MSKIISLLKQAVSDQEDNMVEWYSHLLEDGLGNYTKEEIKDQTVACLVSTDPYGDEEELCYSNGYRAGLLAALQLVSLEENKNEK